MTRWNKTMKGAPRTGREILLVLPEIGVTAGCWIRACGGEPGWWQSFTGETGLPTHWAELPEGPPTTPAETGSVGMEPQSGGMRP